MPGLTRTLKIGSIGADVEAWARGAHRYLHDGQLAAYENQKTAVKRTFGTGKQSLAKQCAAQAGLPQFGVVGPALDAAMREAGAYDALADALFAEYTKDHEDIPDAGMFLRGKVVEIGRQLYARRAFIRYSQARPTQLRPVYLTSALDCSGFVARCMWGAGVMPNVDWRYTNTWSQIKLGVPVLPHEQVLPGDVVLYGSGYSNPTHEALATGDGRVLSMGSYPMKDLPIDYRGDRVAIRRFI